MIGNDFSENEIKNLVSNSFKVALEHGFHDKSFSVEHWLMLAISEIGEAVNADRKQLRADLARFDALMDSKDIEKNPEMFKKCFKDFVKDTVEDEIADVAIRLYDFCGTYSIVPVHQDDVRVLVMLDNFKLVCKDCYLTEACRFMTNILCQCTTDTPLESENDDDVDNIALYVGAALAVCYRIADCYGFQIKRHIDLKSKYNDLRPRLNGKTY